MKCPNCRFENPPESTFCGKCATRIRGHVPAPGKSGTCPPDPPGLGATETLGTAREELTTGAMFAGRYQVIEELGQGGMGKVGRLSPGQAIPIARQVCDRLEEAHKLSVVHRDIDLEPLWDCQPFKELLRPKG